MLQLLNKTNFINSTHLAHGDVVQTIGTVEDHALHSDRLRQVLRGLRLASPGRSLRRTVQVQMVSANQRPIATIRERGDDQAARVTEVLVRVANGRVGESDLAVFVLPIVTQLRKPIEVVLVGYVVFIHVLHYVAGVHVSDNQGAECDSLLGVEFAAYKANDVAHLGVEFAVVVFQALRAILQGFVHFDGPENGGHAEHNLTGPDDHPVVTSFVFIRLRTTESGCLLQTKN